MNLLRNLKNLVKDTFETIYMIIFSLLKNRDTVRFMLFMNTRAIEVMCTTKIC